MLKRDRYAADWRTGRPSFVVATWAVVSGHGRGVVVARARAELF